MKMAMIAGLVTAFLALSTPSTIVIPPMRKAEAVIVTPGMNTSPVAPNAAQARTDPWMAKFNSLARTLPGKYVVKDMGAWGTATYTVIYIARRTPIAYLDDVMKHESMHIRQARLYGTWRNARAQLAKWGGLEPIADCGARMLGATWTHYVRTCTRNMNHAAKAILSGRKP